MGEGKLAKEERFRDWGPGHDGLAHCCAVSVGGVIAMTAIAIGAAQAGFKDVHPITIVAGYLVSALIPTYAYWTHAHQNEKLPSKPKNKSSHQLLKDPHISGRAVLWILLISIGVLAICLWASSFSVHPQINSQFGLAVIVFLTILFFWVATRPYRPGRVVQKDEKKRGVVVKVGTLFSIADAWLVHTLANSFGAQLDKTWRRYLILLGNLVPVLLLGWYLPPAYGAVPILSLIHI